MNVWKSSSHFDLLGLRGVAFVCITRYLRCLPVLISSQSSHKSSYSCTSTDVATTSVSTVQISTFFMSDWLGSFACSNILVSTSAWFEGVTNGKSQGLMNIIAKKLKSSCLLYSKCKNDCQFPGVSKK